MDPIISTLSSGSAGSGTPETASSRRVVYVVPCGAGKLEQASQARSLYTGSMFRSALSGAEAMADGEVLILSALYGLLRLEDEVEPYDLKMGDEGSIGADHVNLQAMLMGLDVGDVDVYAFLPKAYLEVLDAALRPLGIYVQNVYEGTGGIGEQKKVCRICREYPRT